MTLPFWLGVLLLAIGALAALVIVCVAAYGVTEWVRIARGTVREGSHYEGREQMRQLLYADARWFSEDPSTMLLLEEFAKLDVSEARDRWRRRRKERRLGGGTTDGN